MSTLSFPAITGLWRSVQFRRAANGSGFVLLGIHVRVLEATCARLFLLGCKLLSEPFLQGNYGAIHFSAPSEVAGRLALLFPCPSDAEPLVVGPSGKLLSGAAARSSLATRQRGAGGPTQLAAL